MMKPITRSRKIVALAHCVLNQNAVIPDWERARGAFDIAGSILHSGAGVLQLPCPELRYLGCDRPSRTYQQYNTGDYRQHCRQLALPVVSELEEYLRCGYRFLGVVAIGESPTCSVSGQRGVFMEEFLALCQSASIPCPWFEIPEDYSDGGATDLKEAMGRFLDV